MIWARRWEPRVRASIVAIAVAAVPVVLTLWDYRVAPLRTTFSSRMFSQFFDIQAEAMLDGHLWVPDGELGIEAFRHDGREYMYFGPLPALLRLPIVAVTDRFYARLTAPSILVAWCVAAGFAAALVWRIRGLIAPHRSLQRADLVLTSGFITLLTGGSALLFLAANPWVYSEALMWSVATSLGALFGLIGIIVEPTRRRVVLTGAMALASALSRVTAGWGCCLAILGVAMMIYLVPAYRSHRRWLPAIVAVGAVPLTVAILINYAKFGHPILLPFETQAWTDLSQTRRQVLADGGFTGIRFLPSTFVNYFRPDGFRASTIFPYLTAPASAAMQVGGAMLDMRYRTMSATASMPLLLALGLVGLVQVFRPGTTRGAAQLRLPVAGAVTILGGMMFIAYIAQRYVAEFIPALTLTGAAGLVTVLEQADRWTRRTRRLAFCAACVVALFGALATITASMSMSRLASGGTALREFVDVQRRLSNITGHPLDGHVSRYLEPPDTSNPDDIVIVGECDVMFAGTGDLYEPWRTIEFRAIDITVRVGETVRPGVSELVSFEGFRDRSVSIEVGNDDRFRIVLSDSEIGPVTSAWRSVQPDEILTVSVAADVDLEYYAVDSPGHIVEVPIDMTDLRPDLVAEPVVPQPSDAAMSEASRLGLDVTVTREPRSRLCRSLDR